MLTAVCLCTALHVENMSDLWKAILETTEGGIAIKLYSQHVWHMAVNVPLEMQMQLASGVILVFSQVHVGLHMYAPGVHALTQLY